MFDIAIGTVVNPSGGCKIRVLEAGEGGYRTFELEETFFFGNDGAVIGWLPYGAFMVSYEYGGHSEVIGSFVDGDGLYMHAIDPVSFALVFKAILQHRRVRKRTTKIAQISIAGEYNRSCTRSCGCWFNCAIRKTQAFQAALERFRISCSKYTVLCHNIITLYDLMRNKAEQAYFLPRPENIKRTL